MAWARCYGLSSIGLRYFNIFGPRQRPDSPYAAVIPRFAAAMMKGEALTVYGDGEQTRDFTHVDNAVRANLLAGSAPGTLSGEAINIACGEQRSVLELIAIMAELLGATPIIEHAPPRAGDVKHSRASIAKAKALIGYEPMVDFRRGLADALDYYSGLAV
jgi:nucleoside-diphosphate-sugar epimerase